MTTKTTMTLQQAQDALSRDPAWIAERDGLAKLVVNTATGEKRTHAEHRATAYGDDGQYRPNYDAGWMNAATHAYRSRLDALMTATPAAAPPKVEPAAPVRPGASTSMSMAAAKALAAIGRTDREPEPQQQHADASSAGWDRAIQRVAANVPGASAKADAPAEKMADYFRSNLQPAPREMVETKYQEPPTAVVSAGWSKAIASASAGIATGEPSTEGQASSEGEKIQAGWDRAVDSQVASIAGSHPSSGQT